MATQDHHCFSILADDGMKTTTTSTTLDQKKKKKKKTKKKGNPSALQPSRKHNIIPASDGGRKPFDHHQRQGVVKKNVEPTTVAEDDEYPSIAEEGFLHDHTQCIKEMQERGHYLHNVDEDYLLAKSKVDVVHPVMDRVEHVEVILDMESSPSYDRTARAYRLLTALMEEEEEVVIDEIWPFDEIDYDCVPELKPVLSGTC